MGANFESRTVTVTGKNQIALLQWVIRAMSTDKAKDKLCCVNVAADYISCTDGHRLHQIPTELLAMSALANGCYSVIANSKTSIVLELMSYDSFPETSRVVPIVQSHDELLPIFPIFHSDKKSTEAVMIKNIEWTISAAYSIICAHAARFFNSPIQINIAYVKDALKDTYHQWDAYIQDVRRPVLLTNRADNRRAVIMPMVLMDKTPIYNNSNGDCSKCIELKAENKMLQGKNDFLSAQFKQYYNDYTNAKVDNDKLSKIIASFEPKLSKANNELRKQLENVAVNDERIDTVETVETTIDTIDSVNDANSVETIVETNSDAIEAIKQVNSDIITDGYINAVVNTDIENDNNIHTIDNDAELEAIYNSNKIGGEAFKARTKLMYDSIVNALKNNKKIQIETEYSWEGKKTIVYDKLHTDIFKISNHDGRLLVESGKRHNDISNASILILDNNEITSINNNHVFKAPSITDTVETTTIANGSTVEATETTIDSNTAATATNIVETNLSTIDTVEQNYTTTAIDKKFYITVESSSVVIPAGTKLLINGKVFYTR